MIIATRSLVLNSGSREVDIPVRIHAPEKAQVDWVCRFDIGWPERWGTGVDAVQALTMALQMIGVEVYTNRHHESGHLRWLAAGEGYGFPVSNNVRDLLEGNDAKYL